MAEYNPMQIARFDSRGCLMEFMDSFAIGKVKINIAPYDTKTKKQIALNSFYLDFQDWFTISQRIQSGSMLYEAFNEKMMTEQAKANGQNYNMNDLYIQYGGTPKQKLKGKDIRPNNTDESRVLRIYASLAKNDAIMFHIVKGDGEQDKNGAIKPLFNAKIYKSEGTTVVASMPVNYNELRGACQLVDARIQAFIIKQQFDGVFVPNKNNEEESREGINNTPIESQSLNTPHIENVIPDEVAFPTDNNGYAQNASNYQQELQPQPMYQQPAQQPAYQQTVQQPMYPQPAQQPAYGNQQNIPNGNGFFGNPQEPWDVYKQIS